MTLYINKKNKVLCQCFFCFLRHLSNWQLMLVYKNDILLFFIIKVFLQCNNFVCLITWSKWQWWQLTSIHLFVFVNHLKFQENFWRDTSRRDILWYTCNIRPFLFRTVLGPYIRSLSFNNQLQNTAKPDKTIENSFRPKTNLHHFTIASINFYVIRRKTNENRSKLTQNTRVGWGTIPIIHSTNKTH